jgi:hypothetical protein
VQSFATRELPNDARMTRISVSPAPTVVGLKGALVAVPLKRSLSLVGHEPTRTLAPAQPASGERGARNGIARGAPNLIYVNPAERHAPRF